MIMFDIGKKSEELNAESVRIWYGLYFEKMRAELPERIAKFILKYLVLLGLLLLSTAIGNYFDVIQTRIADFFLKIC